MKAINFLCGISLKSFQCNRTEGKAWWKNSFHLTWVPFDLQWSLKLKSFWKLCKTFFTRLVRCSLWEEVHKRNNTSFWKLFKLRSLLKTSCKSNFKQESVWKLRQAWKFIASFFKLEHEMKLLIVAHPFSSKLHDSSFFKSFFIQIYPLFNMLVHFCAKRHKNTNFSLCQQLTHQSNIFFISEDKTPCKNPTSCRVHICQSFFTFDYKFVQ